VTPVGRVKAGQLPATTIARTIYHGDYDGLGAAWGEFEARGAVVLGVSPDASGVLALKTDHAGTRSSVGVSQAQQATAPATDAKFFGIRGNARSVIYLCDASGSMLGTDETISTQLQRAVISLAEEAQK
jgi:hypothetical protein